MTDEIVTKPDLGSPIGQGDPLIPSDLYQNFYDDLEQKLNESLFGNQVELSSYTVLTLPTVTTKPGLIFVSDETGGEVMAFSDGTNWLRCTDRAIVS